MSKPVPTKIALKISENHITFSSLAGIYGSKSKIFASQSLKPWRTCAETVPGSKTFAFTSQRLEAKPSTL